MNKIKRFLLLLCTVSMIGCNQHIDAFANDGHISHFGDNDMGIKVSEIKTLDNGKTIVFVDEKPFKSIGVQIRTDALMNCDHLTIEQCEPFFAKAKELGVNTVEAPVQWKDVEVDDNVFDFSYMDTLLGFVNKYNLKLELLWFGTNMCGDTHSYSVPEYILCDGKTYPKLDAIRTGEFWTYYGIQWFMDFSNDNLIARESNAITQTMNYIYEYDKEHGRKHPVVAFQVLNEADIFPRFRLSQKSVVSKETLNIMTEEEAWEKVLKALDAYGKAVKNSKYVVYTRTNLAASTGSYGISSDNSFSKSSIKLPPEWAKKIFELDGIDAIGDDPYSKKVREIKGLSYMYGENLPGNYPHIAENAGDYTNITSLMIAALSQGAGYNIYDLATPPFFIAHASSATVDQGICRYVDGELINRDHFDSVKNMINGINKFGDLLLTFDRDNFAGFNVNTSSPIAVVNESMQTNRVKINFSTSTGSNGFLVNNNEYADIYCSGDSTITLNNVSIKSVSIGHYENNEFVLEENVETSSTISISGGKLYHVEFNSTPSLITSNAWTYIGGGE